MQRWVPGKKQVIVDQASQVDLDMFGVDLNDEGPVAAFQIKHKVRSMAPLWLPEVYQALLAATKDWEVHSRFPRWPLGGQPPARNCVAQAMSDFWTGGSR
jgi:hypothetical protein